MILSATGYTIEVDDSQAPTYMGDDANGNPIFRIWYLGDFAGSNLDDNVSVEFISGSFDWIGTDGGTIKAITATNSEDLVVTTGQIGLGASAPTATYVALSLGTSQTLIDSSLAASDFTLTDIDGNSITITGVQARGPQASSL